MSTLREELVKLAFQHELTTPNQPNSPSTFADRVMARVDAVLNRTERFRGIMPSRDVVLGFGGQRQPSESCTKAERELIEARVEFCRGATGGACHRLLEADRAVLAEREVCEEARK